jgi:hypothetical protein
MESSSPCPTPVPWDRFSIPLHPCFGVRLQIVVFAFQICWGKGVQTVLQYNKIKKKRNSQVAFFLRANMPCGGNAVLGFFQAVRKVFG